MSLSYTFNSEKGFVHTLASAHIELDQVIDYIDQMINDKSLNSPFVEIVEFQNIEVINFGYYQSDKVIQKLKELQNSHFYKGTILVANTQYTKGMTHIFKTMGQSESIHIQLVETFSQALERLQEFPNS